MEPLVLVEEINLKSLATVSVCVSQPVSVMRVFSEKHKAKPNSSRYKRTYTDTASAFTNEM